MLRVSGRVSPQSVRHAINRDAWPSIIACVEAAPRARGYANVTLNATRAGLEVRIEGPPVQRDAAVRECLERAIRRISIPPADGGDGTVLIRFDLQLSPGTSWIHTSRSPSARSDHRVDRSV